ncbi:MAG: 2OG-Fe(II) oxygenase [Bacteroidetes bacterium]|nr:2OG-Fe(II) oxygenase [Bacteroidota bacterium]
MKKLSTFSRQNIESSLHQFGFAHLPSLLSIDECKRLVDSYSNEKIYRNTIAMERYRFGKGEYKYFSYPLPDLIHQLRQEFYELLVGIANHWSAQLKHQISYPSTHSAFIKMCQTKLQSRPTPLILHYTKGGFNTLHQDLYGEIYFPFQVLISLSQQRKDYDGGEFVMTEQLPRAQSKATVHTPDQGDAIIFTTNFRPIAGTKGYYKSRMKHGVSEIKSGERFALGIIFHDAL